MSAEKLKAVMPMFYMNEGVKRTNFKEEWKISGLVTAE